MKSFPALLLAALLLCGCSSSQKSQVTFTQTDKPGSVYQRFPGAYVASARDGEYDIVLVNDTLASFDKHPSSKKPLQPLNQMPVQQAIHIHVFWRPADGAMIKEVSITNAVIHWYVFGNEGSRGTDMVHYEGAAFVTVKGSDSKPQITIGDGQISPRLVKGDLKDPIGPSKITGTISAVRDESRVRELLASFHAKASSSEPGWIQADADREAVFGK